MEEKYMSEEINIAFNIWVIGMWNKVSDNTKIIMITKGQGDKFIFYPLHWESSTDSCPCAEVHGKTGLLLVEIAVYTTRGLRYNHLLNHNWTLDLLHSTPSLMEINSCREKVQDTEN